MKIVTYNVLAQAHVKAGRYPHSPEAALDSTTRQRKLVDHIAGFDADVYCLQEVERPLLGRLEATLTDHVAHHVLREAYPEGCALFVRSSLGPLEHVMSLGFGLIGFLNGLAIASVHLTWGRNEAGDAHPGLRQMRELLDIRAKSNVPAWIVGGDLNATSQSRIVQAALDAGLELGARAQRPWDTTNINGNRRKLDYLLYTPEHFTPFPGCLPKLERDTPMPSFDHASDHLALAIDFEQR